MARATKPEEDNTPDTTEAKPRQDAGQQTTNMPTYTADELPDRPYGRFMKRQAINAVRIDGPFRVQTREGELECPDGWLALDSGGQPYPIAVDEFERVYEAVHQEEALSTHVGPPVDGGWHRMWRVQELRELFTSAILQNPNVERFLYGNPLEPGRRQHYASVGDMLAHLCDQLALDYYEQATALDEERRPEDEPTAEAESTATPHDVTQDADKANPVEA